MSKRETDYDDIMAHILFASIIVIITILYVFYFIEIGAGKQTQILVPIETIYTTSGPAAEPTPEPTPVPTQTQIIDIVPLGEYRYTYYTNSIEDCGKTDGITYSGAKAVDGITIAADLSIIPLGSWVYIDSIGLRMVQDKGGAVKGRRIDIYVDKKTMDRVTRGNVYLIREGDINGK